MNDDTITDLKQFITATVSQATAHLATKDDLVALENRIDTKMDSRFDAVDKRFDEVQGAIAESMAITNDDIDTRFAQHDARITKLEQQAA